MLFMLVLKFLGAVLVLTCLTVALGLVICCTLPSERESDTCD